MGLSLTEKKILYKLVKQYGLREILFACTDAFYELNQKGHVMVDKKVQDKETKDD